MTSRADARASGYPRGDSPASPEPASPEAIYQERLARFEAQAAGLRRSAHRLAAGRLGSFAVAFALVVGAVLGTGEPRLPLLWAAAAVFALFLVLVVWDGRLRRRLVRVEGLATANAHALARLGRRFRELPEPPAPTGDLPPAARDLHLFGHGSLAHLLGTVRTFPGRQTLERWLAASVVARELPAPSELAERHGAVRELAGALDFRQQLEILAGEAGGAAPELERFYAWAEGEPWLARRPLTLWAARLFAVVVPATGLGVLFGWFDFGLWLALAFGAYLLSALHAGEIGERFDRAAAGGDGFAGYGALFAHLESLPPTAPRLEELARRLCPEGRSAAHQMDRLARLDNLADARHGTIHFVIQVLFGWDFHVLHRLEVWQREAGPEVRGWLEALGEVEALAGLAELAHAHPGWASPEVATDDTPPALRAERLGHPLLAPAERVDNDVELGPPGTFLLVTGSNMSGKTTLLRAVGANVVLAQAGGPVAARSLTMPPTLLATSIGIEDSLLEGISYFMAELLRLKRVVETAESPPPGVTVLYLLDEILRGTNSGERQIAVARVIGHLLELGAIGAVTTHDLEILAEGRLETSAHTIHFRETITPSTEGGAAMTFDYTARPGLAPTTNALRLLEAVGLGLGQGDEEDR